MTSPHARHAHPPTPLPPTPSSPPPSERKSNGSSGERLPRRSERVPAAVINGRRGNLAAGAGAKLTGPLPETAGRRRANDGEARREEAHGDGGKSNARSLSLQSQSRHFKKRKKSLVSGSRGEMCARLLCNTSARITSHGAGMLQSVQERQNELMLKRKKILCVKKKKKKNGAWVKLIVAGVLLLL